MILSAGSLDQFGKDPWWLVLAKVIVIFAFLVVMTLFAIWYEGAASVAQGMVYRTVHDGPFRLQPEEVVRGEFLPLDQVALRIQQDPFCPDGLFVLREYQQRASFRTCCQHLSGTWW